MDYFTLTVCYLCIAMIENGTRLPSVQSADCSWQLVRLPCNLVDNVYEWIALHASLQHAKTYDLL
ncbi:hypothetical protein J6590_070355 [Homalodisca vitripennis]|nr:hypothetical protein J6590_070355 [Homalodisca vitripennis]